MIPSNITAYVKGLLAKGEREVALAFTYGYHLALAWLISWGLRHGFHLDTGYLGLSFLTFFGKFGISELASAYGTGAQRGALVAHEAHAAKHAAAATLLDNFLADLSANQEKPAAKADGPTAYV